MEVIFVVRVMKDRIKEKLLDLRHSHDVAGQSHADLEAISSLKPIHSIDLDRLACITDEELRICTHLQGPLVHAQITKLADERIADDLEAMRDHVLRRI